MSPEPTPEAQEVQVTVLGITIDIVNTCARPTKQATDCGRIRVRSVQLYQAKMEKLNEDISLLKGCLDDARGRIQASKPAMAEVKDKRARIFEEVRKVRDELHCLRCQERELKNNLLRTRQLRGKEASMDGEIEASEAKLKEVLTLKEEKWHVERLQTLKRSKRALQPSLSGMKDVNHSALKELSIRDSEEIKRIQEAVALGQKLWDELRAKREKVVEEMGIKREETMVLFEKQREIRERLKKLLDERNCLQKEHRCAMEELKRYRMEQMRARQETQRRLTQEMNTRMEAMRKARKDECDKECDVTRFLRISKVLEQCWGLLHRLEREQEGAEDDDTQQQDIQESAAAEVSSPPDEVGEPTNSPPDEVGESMSTPSPSPPKGKQGKAKGRANAKSIFTYHVVQLHDFSFLGLDPPTTKEELQATISSLEEKLLESDKSLDRWQWGSSTS